MAKFSKAAYELIAADIRTVRQEFAGNIIAETAIDNVAHELGKTFADDNPNFDLARFERAAGQGQVKPNTIKFAAAPIRCGYKRINGKILLKHDSRCPACWGTVKDCTGLSLAENCSLDGHIHGPDCGWGNDERRPSLPDRPHRPDVQERAVTVPGTPDSTSALYGPLFLPVCSCKWAGTAEPTFTDAMTAAEAHARGLA